MRLLVRRRTRTRLGLAIASMALIGLAGHGPSPGLAQGILQPRLFPQGEWGEVVSATAKWIVVRNERGQQFPIAVDRDHVGLFVIRWPIAPEQISRNAVIEVLGIDLGTNQVRADHLDVFENEAKAMLGTYWPAVTNVVGYNRIQTPYSVNPNNVYNGWDLVWPLPGENAIPNRLHVVAPAVGVNPLRLAVNNNNVITVLPGAAGTYMTQVTAGSTSYVRPGDLVFYMPVQAQPKSLSVVQLIVYKKITLAEFAP